MKKWLFILLSIGIVSSCTQESLFPSKEDKMSYTAGEIKVYIQNPEATTRSNWEYDSYFPNSDILHKDTKIERWLHNLWLISFDSDLLLEYAIKHRDYSQDSQLAINTLENTNSEGAFSVFTLGIAGIPLTTGAHYFYILANLHSMEMTFLEEFFKDKIGILTKDEFEKLTIVEEYSRNTIKDITEIVHTQDTVYKPRCMMTNPVSPPPHYMADKSLTTGDRVGYPHVNGISMTIGKSFAKVSVAVPEGKCTALSDVEYRIVNDPVQMYMLPNIFKGQVHTPHYNREPDSNFDDYFKKYFNPISHISYEFKEDELGEYDDNDPDNTAPLYKCNFTWRKANTSTTATKKTYAYCMENANATPLQGNSTMVLLQAKYTPEEWLDREGNTTAPSGDGTFWRIKNASGTYRSGYYAEIPVVTGSQTVEKYTGGITYYPIWLETEGKYMVERNHYYKLAITEVLSAGANSLESVMTPQRPLTTNTRSTSSGKSLPEAATAIRWVQKN